MNNFMNNLTGDFVNSFDEYQKSVKPFDCYPKQSRFHDLVHGLCSESGEIAGLAKKIDRDNITDSVLIRERILRELGDVLWYVAMTAEHFMIPLSEVASVNIQKLTDRKKNGTIHGDGDNR